MSGGASLAISASLMTIAALCAGCVSATMPVETPGIVVGVFTRPLDTDWYRNICFDGALVRQLPDSGYCIPHGGVVYRVRLRKPMDIHGKRLGSYIDVAYAAHGIRPDYRKADFDMVLQPAPEEFMKSTGIGYFATASQVYDDVAKCVVENGRAHTDSALCVAPEFHETHRGRCVPVNTFLEHYTEHPHREAGRL